MLIHIDRWTHRSQFGDISKFCPLPPDSETFLLLLSHLQNSPLCSACEIIQSLLNAVLGIRNFPSTLGPCWLKQSTGTASLLSSSWVPSSQRERFISPACLIWEEGTLEIKSTDVNIWWFLFCSKGVSTGTHTRCIWVVLRNLVGRPLKWSKKVQGPWKVMTSGEGEDCMSPCVGHIWLTSWGRGRKRISSISMLFIRTDEA